MGILFMQQKYSTTVPATNFYGTFRDWVNSNYPDLTGDVWTAIIEEDEAINY
jgi:hypothetical protein